jgi:exonuclease SbcC
LGLLSLEDKENVAKDIWKKQISPTLLCNKYDRATLASEITDYETCNKENEDEIKKLETELSDIEKEIDTLGKEKEDVLRSRKEINSELEKLDVTTIENRLSMKQNELEIKRGQLTAKKEEYAKVKDAVFSVDDYEKLKTEIKEKGEKKHSIELKNAELKSKIAGLRSENRRIQELIDGRICPTCGQQIDETTQTDSIAKNELEIKRLITNGTTNKQRIDKISVEIVELEEKQGIMESDRERVNERQRLEPTMIAIKANIDTIKLEIEKLEGQRKEIENNRDNIKYNNEIDNKIRLIGVNIVEKTRVKDDKIRLIQSCKNNIEYNSLKINERNETIKKLVEEEKIVKEWQVYQELVGKNGVVKIVLKQALPILNNEIKRTLDGLCDFDVVLDIDDKNDVCINLVCDGVEMPIEKGASGFEATFGGIAVRNALATISSLSRPNYLTLDEVDSTINPENMDNLYELYNRILTNYDFIFHIVHTDNEEVIAKHNQIVTVVKENHISKIDF